jgi:hypothetical protein
VTNNDEEYDIAQRKLLTPGPSTTRTTEPLNCEDIFHADAKGVTGSAAVLINNIGELVFSAVTGPIR